MDHGPGASQAAAAPDSPVAKILPFVSVATMVMTLPQIWTVWVDRQVAGVSMLSWGHAILGACDMTLSACACSWRLHRPDPSARQPDG